MSAAVEERSDADLCIAMAVRCFNAAIRGDMGGNMQSRGGLQINWYELTPEERVRNAEIGVNLMRKWFELTQNESWAEVSKRNAVPDC
jgi:hypothetical protein